MSLNMDLPGSDGNLRGYSISPRPSELLKWSLANGCNIVPFPGQILKYVQYTYTYTLIRVD